MKARTIYGRKISQAEQKAMNAEVMKQLVEINRKNLDEMDATVLYVLHEHFGFGPKRLKQFYDTYNTAITDLGKRYEMETEEDKIWLCTYKLKQYGIDIKAWNDETDKNK